VVVSNGDLIQTADLPVLLNPKHPSKPPVRVTPETDEQTMDEIERKAILDVLAQADGNISKAGRLLGLGRSTIYRKLRKYEKK